MSIITIAAVAVIFYVFYQISENEKKKEIQRKAEAERNEKEWKDFQKEMEEKAMDTWMHYDRH